MPLQVRLKSTAWRARSRAGVQKPSGRGQGLLRPADETVIAMSRPSHILVLLLAASLGTAAPALAAGGSGGAQAVEETASSVASPSSTGGQAIEPTQSGGAVASAAGATPAPVVVPGAELVPIAAPAEGPIMGAAVPHGPLIAATARRYGISASLLTALVWQESGFRERARSKAGARGLTQLMPATARELGVRRIYDPAQNVDGGARYLRAQLVRFGRADLALAAYNAGPGAVVKHRGIPPFRETRQYVAKVLAYEAHLRASGVR